jgi:chromosome segregation ATPase
LAEIDSYKKSIIKEQETNESLTIRLNQRKSETKNLDKSLKINKDKMDTLQQEYSAYNRALKETESALNAINMVNNFIIIFQKSKASLIYDFKI